MKTIATAGPSDDQLSAAKAAVLGEIADNFESRAGLVGALATSTSAAAGYAAVEAVTADSLKTYAQQLLAGEVAIASLGDISAVPRQAGGAFASLL